jgi:ferredoxin-fold anticodon binding domain-containing protein
MTNLQILKIRMEMEDDLKILKVKYLSNSILDHTKFLNLSLDNQTILYKLRLRWQKQTVQIL